MITKIEQANCAREYKLSAQFGTLNFKKIFKNENKKDEKIK